jgi:hypothetical protein
MEEDEEHEVCRQAAYYFSILNFMFVAISGVQ